VAGNVQATLVWLGRNTQHLSSDQGGREKIGPERGGGQHEAQEGVHGRAQSSHKDVEQGEGGEQLLGEKTPWDYSHYMKEEEKSLQLILQEQD
jgi:hypothetical protein